MFFCLIAVLTTAVTISMLRHLHRARVGVSLSSLALCVMLWLLAYCIATLFDQTPTAPLVVMYIVDYLAFTTGIIMLYFARVFTGCRGKWYWPLWFYPTIVYGVLYLPNLWGRGLVSYSATLVGGLGYRVVGMLTPAGNLMFYIGYAISFMAVLTLLIGLVRVNINYRPAASFLIVVVILPFVASFIQTFVFFDRPNFYDYTPLLLAIGIISIALFIRKTKITNLCLLARDQFFDDILNAVIVIDHQGYVLDANRQAGEMFQSSIKYLVGRQIRAFFPLDEKNRIRREQGEKAPPSYPWTNARNREYEVYTHEFTNDYHDVLGEVLTFQEVTEFNQLLNQTVQLSIRDSLTNAYNRRHFEALAEKQFAHARRYAAPFSILMLDINHFKAVNDQYGHIAGDRLLVKAVEIFHHEIRESDTVARYGGDEFVIVLPNTDLRGAIQAAQRITRHCRSTDLRIDEIHQSVNLSISIGVAAWHSFLSKSEQALTVEELIHQADQALYFAKQAPSGDMAFYESGACRLIPVLKP